jgi:hypothetical protein
MPEPWAAAMSPPPIDPASGWKSAKLVAVSDTPRIGRVLGTPLVSVPVSTLSAAPRASASTLAPPVM